MSVLEDMMSSPPPRSQWPRLLQVLDTTTTQALAKRFSQSFRVVDIKLPESGLALLRNRDGARGEDYFLGEIPLARAHVRLFMGEQLLGEGGAQILDDRSDLARAIAILDTVLASKLPGHEDVCELLCQGIKLIEQQQKQRAAMISSTLVDFSLLGNDEGSNDD